MPTTKIVNAVEYPVETYDEFCTTRSIRRDTRTGKYGYQRTGDITPTHPHGTHLNLNCCVYATYKAAAQARRDAWRMEQDVLAAIEAGRDPTMVGHPRTSGRRAA